MTSIELFRKSDPSAKVPPDWGTGRYSNEDLWLPRGPTWQTTGQPLEHNYSLTALKLSNVRDNDELVPRPQGTDISGRKKLKKVKVQSSQGEILRGLLEGFPYRHEIQALPTEGKKLGLYWPGENYFDQQSKIHGNRQQFYPIPPKQTAPNLQDRPLDQQLSDKSQNVLRNIERNQWIPSQKLDYTGLGPANPMSLDNLDCKREALFQTGEPDDKLYPRSINTFDPARPMEGRLRKLFAPTPPRQTMLESGMKANPEHRRKLTLTEREEDRLLNGKEYVNLPCDPNDPQKDMRWQDIDHSARPEPRLERLNTAQQMARESEEFEVPEFPAKQTMAEVSPTYLQDQKDEKHKAIQGMEAQNRWKVLEHGTPDHDVAQLKDKYKLLTDKEMPSTFYRHEGRYNEERAGLYKTSYDPQRLAYSMNNQQQSGGVLFNTSASHMEASQYPTVTWDENEAALKGSRTVVFKNSELSGDRPSTSDMLNPYRETVAIQRASLQPSVASARPRVQEKEFVLREDTYGDCYNTKKFLQENKLDRNIRIEPSDLISHENQNLERTRDRVAPRDSMPKPGKLKSVHFSNSVHVQNFHENFPVQVGQSHTQPLSCEEQEQLREAFGQNNVQSLTFLRTHPEREASGSSSFMLVGDTRNMAENTFRNPAVPTVVARNTEPPLKSAEVCFSRNPQLRPPPQSETADEFRSLSTNFMPVGLKCDYNMRSSYSSQFPIYDLSEKKDRRFIWEPGMGGPRPQSCLLDMQDGFIKSEVRRRFQAMYPETNPEIRMNINTGKKHTFFGMNAQVIHG
ncbi:uncharacterized protein LOC101853704 [Aplysia californica]|uniref:Uncharacterized protein LOC101853704 n=1 Tax=Aplysia californica TaxID=6500 RepID=A0ABM1A2U3_APLCA|nr:uncharacterized protein LOC101853704 [Aplysia californica]